ncbi:MAG: hypothetical protein AAGA30_10305 [Planctomycetota bacterium]
MIQLLDQMLLIAQRNQQGQTEYMAAYALTIGLILLGLIAVCVPRPRVKHFVEPEEEDPKKKK